jgi:hypothetical protein
VLQFGVSGDKQRSRTRTESKPQTSILSEEVSDKLQHFGATKWCILSEKGQTTLIISIYVLSIAEL